MSVLRELRETGKVRSAKRSCLTLCPGGTRALKVREPRERRWTYSSAFPTRCLFGIRGLGMHWWLKLLEAPASCYLAPGLHLPPSGEPWQAALVGTAQGRTSSHMSRVIRPVSRDSHRREGAKTLQGHRRPRGRWQSPSPTAPPPTLGIRESQKGELLRPECGRQGQGGRPRARGPIGCPAEGSLGISGETWQTPSQSPGRGEFMNGLPRTPGAPVLPSTDL